MKEPTLTDLLEDWQAHGAAGHVARALSGRGGRSLTQLAALTGYSKSTISAVLAELRRSGLVVENGAPRRSRETGAGRPEVVVSLNPEAGTSVGILIGLEHIQVVVVDVAHTILGERTIRLAPDYSPEDALAIATGLIDEIYRDRALDRSTLLGVGLAVAAPINPRNGRVLRAGGVPTWAGKDIRQVFEPALGVPIFSDNESNCSAIAQMMWGVATELDDFVLFTLDLGVGGAIVHDGQVITGFAGSAGEFGHMTIDPSGPLCRCGNRGCLERYISDPLLELVHDPALPRPLSRIVRDAIDGEPIARSAVVEAARIAGRGLGIIGTVINPPVIVVGGELALAGDLVVIPLAESFEANTLVRTSEVGEEARTRFIAASFVDRESCLGAAGLVLRHHGRLV